MTVSVCVPWRDTGCPHRQAAWQWTATRWRTLHPDWPIVTGQSHPGPFNIASALNDTIAHADTTIAVLVGADTVFDETVLTQAIELAVQGHWVLPAATLLRPSPETTARLLAQPADIDSIDDLPGHRQQCESGWGPIVAPVNLLREIGGWDERFEGWGGEDEAFNITATTLVGPVVQLDGTVCLLWHPSPSIDPVLYDRNLALLGRYQRVAGDPAAIRTLISDRQCEYTHMGMRCLLSKTHPAPHKLRALVGSR